MWARSTAEPRLPAEGGGWPVHGGWPGHGGEPVPGPGVEGGAESVTDLCRSWHTPALTRRKAPDSIETGWWAEVPRAAGRSWLDGACLRGAVRLSIASRPRRPPRASLARWAVRPRSPPPAAFPRGTPSPRGTSFPRCTPSPRWALCRRQAARPWPCCAHASHEVPVGSMTRLSQRSTVAAWAVRTTVVASYCVTIPKPSMRMPC